MSAVSGLSSARLWTATAAFALAVATGAAAQTAAQATAQAQPAAQAPAPAPEPTEAPNTSSSLRIPENLQLFGRAMPSVVKATAIVNNEIITQTDVEQRLALLVIANGGQIPPEELERLRQQVLRNLIDETLQIQAAKAEEIDIKQADVDRTLERVAGNVKQTPAQLTEFLKANGSSIRTMRRQILGEIAWSRLQRAKIVDFVNVADDEVKAVIDRLNASKGSQQYKVGEIYIAAAGNEAQAQATAGQILQQLRQGASFAGYARQFSQASTAAVGGDLGWVRPEQLPDPIAAVVRQMGPGAISNPIPVSGGFSIIAVEDTRKVLTADPRNAVFSLKQVSVNFPKGTPRAQAEPVVTRFAEAARNVAGCGGADRLANEFNAELVQSDQVKLRDLPPLLQQIMMPMQVGQATQPYGNIDEGVRVLVICGRDEVDPTLPTPDEIEQQLTDERVNLRAQRYLRDLRRDAVIEFR